LDTYAFAAFSLDRKLMVTRYGDGAVRVWDLEIGATIRASATSFQDSPVAYAKNLRNSLAVSPDKKLVASGAYEAVDIWDTATGFLVTQLKVGSGRVDSLAFSSAGHQLLVGSDDEVVRLYDVSGYNLGVELPVTPVRLLKSSARDWIWSVAWAPDDYWIVAGDTDGGIHFWSVDGTPQFMLQGHTEAGVSQIM
jgi:hypothetical protein